MKGKLHSQLVNRESLLFFIFLFFFVFCFFTRCMNLKYYRQSLVFKMADSYVALFEDYDERSIRRQCIH